MKDIALHAIAAFLLALAILTGGAAGLVLAITLMWLLRELAQRDGSNLWNALAGMPEWSLAKHAEWLVTGFAAALAIVLFKAVGGP